MGKNQKKQEAEKQEAEISPAGISTLEFGQYGWCRELDPPFRYEKGFYKPKNMAEYEALKKYAK